MKSILYLKYYFEKSSKSMRVESLMAISNAILKLISNNSIDINQILTLFFDR